MLIRIFLLGIVLTTLFSCGSKDDYQKITGTAQGTTYAITFRGSADDFSKAQADSLFNVIDKSMSLWDSTSLLSRFNNSPKTQAIDEHFYNVLQKSFEIYDLSEGAFDPTVGPLIKAYGFIRKQNLAELSQASIDSILPLIHLNKVSFNEHQVEKDNPKVQLDFNAIAQGYTVDIIASFLENKGMEHYLVEVGGEVRARGVNKENVPWKVGIEQPNLNESNETNPLQLVVGLDNVSLATSGSYRNFIEVNGKRISHILDPTTGKPVTHNVVSVSVIAPTCTEADAWATAFTVLGKEKSLKIAKKLDFEAQITSLSNGQLEVVQTEGFKKLVQ